MSINTSASAALGASEHRPQRCAMCLRLEREVPVLVNCGLIYLCGGCIQRATAALTEWTEVQGWQELRALEDVAEAEIKGEIKS